jgi:hypothetical protein
MTTRGIRRKKSYLVDAKIAVCGQKSVGKSGNFCVKYIIYFPSKMHMKISIFVMRKLKRSP